MPCEFDLVTTAETFDILFFCKAFVVTIKECCQSCGSLLHWEADDEVLERHGVFFSQKFDFSRARFKTYFNEVNTVLEYSRNTKTTGPFLLYERAKADTHVT